MAQDAHALKSHGNKGWQKEQRSCVSHSHPLQGRCPLGAMTGSPMLRQVLFLSLLCFVFAEQGHLNLDRLEADIHEMGDTGLSKWEPCLALGAVLTAKEQEGTFCSDGTAAYPDLGGGSTHVTLLKIYQAEWLRRVHVTGCKLYLN